MILLRYERNREAAGVDLYRSREILRSPEVRVGADALRVAADVVEHTHDFVEVAFVLSGSGDHRSAAGTRTVSRGSVVIIRPGSWHAYSCRNPMTIFNLYLAPELFQEELAWVLDYPRLGWGVLRSGESLALVAEPSLDRIEAWLHQLTELIPERRLPALLGLVGCVLSELINADFDSGRTDGSVVTDFVRHAMRLLGEDIEREWVMADLAAEVNVSPSHLHRQFRSQVGMSPMSWLNQLRGERAATLLVQTDLPISEIGRAVGWQDPNYMSRRFRSIYSTRPSEYRARFRVG